MFEYFRRNTSLKLVELEVLILEFSKENHSVEEIFKYRDTLLDKAHYKVVKKYIHSEIDRLLKKVKNDVYIAPPVLYVQVAENKLSENLIDNDKFSVLSCNYKDFTVAQFSMSMDVKFSIIENLIKQKNTRIIVSPDSQISEKIWSYIKDFSIQKITLILRRLKYNPQEQQKALEINKKRKDREYETKISANGSIYRVLYTGMID